MRIAEVAISIQPTQWRSQWPQGSGVLDNLIIIFIIRSLNMLSPDSTQTQLMDIAANALPEWLSPENGQFRAYLR
eukprot:1336633-Amorphochlora_amoeboformis.AAC.1